MKTYKAIVRNEKNESEIIEMDYPTKSAFIHDLRANGYKFSDHKVKEAKEFDRIMNETNCQEWDWN